MQIYCFYRSDRDRLLLGSCRYMGSAEAQAQVDLFNFPEGLSIVPLAVQKRRCDLDRLPPSSSSAASVRSSSRSDDLDEAERQRAWIERYGIAGRIWYVRLFVGD